MSSGANPYILFLILILLVLGTDPEAGAKVEVLRNVMDKVTSAMNNFRTGISSMAADFEEVHVLLQGIRAPGGQPKI